MVDRDGGVATIDDITVTINGEPWEVVSLDPTTGVLEIADYPEEVFAQTYTLTAEDVARRGIWLPGYPMSALAVNIISGSSQYYPTDFHMNGRFMSWNGSSLRALLSVGDQLRISCAINYYINAELVISYHIRNSFITTVMTPYWSRLMDDDDVFPYYCYDQESIHLDIHMNEYYGFLSDYSEGIRVQYFNALTYQIEDHVFSGPVFEFHTETDDEIGSPENFPNALVRLRDAAHPSNPMAGAYDFDFINDTLVRFKKKTFKELLPDRSFRTIHVTEMAPV